MAPESNPHPNEDAQALSSRKTYTIIRWTLVGFFALFALINGLHVSILFFFSAAFLMLPFPLPKTPRLGHHILMVLSTALACVLFFAGAFLSPLPEENDPLLNGGYRPTADLMDHQTDTETDKISSNDGGSQSSTETEQEDTAGTIEETATDGTVLTVVWISPSGSKYHAKPDCSNMVSAQELAIEDAVADGYEPCKRCFKNE